MSSTTFAVHAAVMARLKELALVPEGHVHDEAPEQAPYPFIEIGGAGAIPDDTSAEEGSDEGAVETFDLHIWSSYRGRKESLEIADAIKAAFHQTDLAVEGRASAICMATARRGPMAQPDGILRQTSSPSKSPTAPNARKAPP